MIPVRETEVHTFEDVLFPGCGVSLAISSSSVVGWLTPVICRVGKLRRRLPGLRIRTQSRPAKGAGLGDLDRMDQVGVESAVRR